MVCIAVFVWRYRIRRRLASVTAAFLAVSAPEHGSFSWAGHQPEFGKPSLLIKLYAKIFPCLKIPWVDGGRLCLLGHNGDVMKRVLASAALLALSASPAAALTLWQGDMFVTAVSETNPGTSCKKVDVAIGDFLRAVFRPKHLEGNGNSDLLSFVGSHSDSYTGDGAAGIQFENATLTVNDP